MQRKGTIVFTVAAVSVALAGSAGAGTPTALQPGTLPAARLIQADVSGRYLGIPGRRLVVTEASSLGVVDSITLVTDWFAAPRVVPSGNGVYFAICTARSRCPYPARRAAWPVTAFLPRRLALELAVRTFRRTTADLVVVSLPTESPAWVVFERADLLRVARVGEVLDALSGRPETSDTHARELVERLTGPRLFEPLPILPPPPGTIVAASIAV